MSNVIFLFETFNPNKRTTFFKHKNYTNYLAYSEYAIRNQNTAHGLFGKINEFPNIQEMNDIEQVSKHITELARNKVPIYRITLSLEEYDAIRLGYDKQEKWKVLFEGKLVSLAEKMNIKYEDLQYAGAVHLESGHPHLQVMIWSKQQYKMNYYIDYGRINKMRDEFTNAIFREDLIQLYNERDIAKKELIEKNSFLQKLKNINSDPKFLKDIMQYKRDFTNKRIMKKTFKDKELQKLVDELLALKQQLKTTKGSIKYQYLKKYPDIIKQIDSISRTIIDMSLETKMEIEKYILAKQQIVSFKYQDQEKIVKAQEIEKQKAEEEILKLIGNQILNFERVLLNEQEEYSNIRYVNYSRDLIWRVFDCIYFSTRQEEKYAKRYEFNYKKQLSKQAKKDLAIKKANSSSFNWEDDR
ncbi:MAG TPA: hypothetical protein DCZ30_02240 [Clostridiales bacterium]|nr:hypothetical protein [Clostridiales bacterium]